MKLIESYTEVTVIVPVNGSMVAVSRPHKLIGAGMLCALRFLLVLVP